MLGPASMSPPCQQDLMRSSLLLSHFKVRHRLLGILGRRRSSNKDGSQIFESRKYHHKYFCFSTCLSSRAIPIALSPFVQALPYTLPTGRGIGITYDTSTFTSVNPWKENRRVDSYSRPPPLGPPTRNPLLQIYPAPGVWVLLQVVH